MPAFEPRRSADAAKPVSAQAQAPQDAAPNTASAEPAAPPAPQTKLPTPEEASNDPLVKAVIEVFEGSVKQVYPRK